MFLFALLTETEVAEAPSSVLTLKELVLSLLFRNASLLMLINFLGTF